MKHVSHLAMSLALTIAAALMPIAARADGDAVRGEKKFEDCAACHTFERGVNNVGPTLAGLFGRKAGEISDFRYSPALKRSAIVWTPQSLDEFVADPQKLVPANRMPYAGMPDATDRADLIAYLQNAAK